MGLINIDFDKTKDLIQIPYLKESFLLTAGVLGIVYSVMIYSKDSKPTEIYIKLIIKSNNELFFEGYFKDVELAEKFSDKIENIVIEMGGLKNDLTYEASSIELFENYHQVRSLVIDELKDLKD